MHNQLISNKGDQNNNSKGCRTHQGSSHSSRNNNSKEWEWGKLQPHNFWLVALEASLLWKRRMKSCCQIQCLAQRRNNNQFHNKIVDNPRIIRNSLQRHKTTRMYLFRHSTQWLKNRKRNFLEAKINQRLPECANTNYLTLRKRPVQIKIHQSE